MTHATKKRRLASLVRWAIAAGTIGAIGTAIAVQASGCAQPPITVPLRSLERSGNVSYVCLAAPGNRGGILQPLETCATSVSDVPSDFEPDSGIAEDGGVLFIPHLYGLVTQTTRGEVAVIDITAQTNSVLDENPGIPGANFLPVGAQPTDIVSTPGSTATFVTVAEVARPGIFALPSLLIRPSDLTEDAGLEDAGFGNPIQRPAPEISTWPACSLPSAPGAMLLIADPDVSGTERASCDASYTAPRIGGPNGDIVIEGKGRQKLVIAMPDLGGIIVVDAQRLLDRDRGTFAPCDIERWVPLKVDLPTTVPPAKDRGAACVYPAPVGPPLPSPLVSRPSGMSYGGGRLYIGDLAAPVVHVVDLATPCEPLERAPLLPTSADDPSRIVLTKKVSVGAQTTTLQRFLYAIDEKDGSTMVFDVSDASATRQPIPRRHPEWNPLEPRDRIRYASPAADVLLVTHDAAEALPTTGIAPEGTFCSPNPALQCPIVGPVCDLPAIYRTSPTFDFGAGPLKLRGEFGFLALTSGRLAVIDLEDFDGPCRVPQQYSPLYGCPPPGSTASQEDPTILASSLEASCNVVLPNAPRSAVYTAADDNAGRHQPGIEVFPQLYDQDGTLLTDPASPRMVATVPLVPTAVDLTVSLGTVPTVIDKTTGTITDTNGPENTLAMNLEDPRAQIVDQAWTVTFEGALPGFQFQVGEVRVPRPVDLAVEGMYDPGARFCDSGVQSERAVRELLKAQGVTGNAVNTDAAAFADYVQLFTDLPPQTDAHWRDAKSCSYAECSGYYGTVLAPTVNRDLRIVEAYEDHVLLVERSSGKPLSSVQPAISCCFASGSSSAVVAFNVRVGSQWAVVGSANGFLHHVVADPATGECRNNCDPVMMRMNGRVVGLPPSAIPITDADSRGFINPMFRFAITQTSVFRDSQFQFATQGAFLPLLIELAPDDQTLMQPVSMSFLPPTGEIGITDGSINGLTMVSLSGTAVSRRFF